jgi:hypothetical protein
MKFPFSTDQFLDVFKEYNEAVWPVQVIFYLIGFFTLFQLIRHHTVSNRIISLFLAFFWIWMGIVYHLIHFSNINPAAYIFGPAFIIECLLIFYFLFVKKKMQYSFRKNLQGVAGIVFILFSIIIYPVIGYMLGHIYPYSPTFGLPCPTTIFTLGVLCLSEKRIPWIVIIIPLIWSVIGFTASFSFGIKEDISLLIAGIVFLLLYGIRSRNPNTGNKEIIS